MRILLVPSAEKSGLQSSALLAQNLTDLAVHAGHSIGICAPEVMNFHNASLYQAELPGTGFHPFRRKRDPGKTYEEYLYSCGMLDGDYLKQDIGAIIASAKDFAPDLIIDMGRPSAVIAAGMNQIPCWSIVHAAMYRSRPFPRIALNELNSTLSSLHLEQVLRLTDLYQSCGRRITFSPAVIQPFADLNHITRLGGMSLIPAERSTLRHLSIFLGSCAIAPSKLQQMVRDAWSGAPYEVYAWIDGCSSSTEENLHFSCQPKLQTLDSPDAVIHDGNEYLYNQCLMRGIPQIIVTDGTWRTSWDAQAAGRVGFGISLNLDLLSMATLYESYRRLLSDDWFRLRAEAMKEEYRKLGDLNAFLELLK